MVEQLLPAFYRIEVPLPGSPLKAVNSYLIKGPERSLIVDTGMNREECFRPLLSSLGELGVDLNRADFFITHLHADHLGLVGRLATQTSKIYFSKVEAAIVTSTQKRAGARVNEFFEFYLSQGFPEQELKRAVERHPGFRYSMKCQVDFSELKEGSTLDVGDYSFRCIETPGHSPGHMCLYEAKKKILLSGDHILRDITPNITRWPELENSLKAYLASLEKVLSLDVNIVLPGHRSIFNDHTKRITELKEHHRKRLDEAFVAVDGGKKTAWDVAPHVTWDIAFKSWDLFPPVQKWFAIGEVIAHLNYLVSEGRLRKQEQNGKVTYGRP